MLLQIELSSDGSCLLIHADKEGFKELYRISKALDIQKNPSFIPASSNEDACAPCFGVALDHMLLNKKYTPFHFFPSERSSSIVERLYIRYVFSETRVFHVMFQEGYPVLCVNEQGWQDWFYALEIAVVGPALSFITYKSPLSNDESHIYFDQQTLSLAVKEKSTIPALAFFRRELDENVPWLHVFSHFWLEPQNVLIPGVIKGNVAGQKELLKILKDALKSGGARHKLPYSDGRNLIPDWESNKYKVERIGPLLLEYVELKIIDGELNFTVSDKCLFILGREEALKKLFNKCEKLIQSVSCERISGTAKTIVTKEGFYKTAAINELPWIWRGGLMLTLQNPLYIAYLQKITPGNLLENNLLKGRNFWIKKERTSFLHILMDHKENYDCV